MTLFILSNLEHNLTASLFKEWQDYLKDWELEDYLECSPLPDENLEVNIENIDEVELENINLKHLGIDQKITKSYNNGVVFNNGDSLDDNSDKLDLSNFSL